MKKLLLLLLLFVIPGYSQTWQKIAGEGASQAASPVVTLWAGATYRFGYGTNWCDSITVPASLDTTQVTVWYQSIACTVGGAKMADPAPGKVKELDVLSTATPQSVAVSINGASTIVSVPAGVQGKTVVWTKACTLTITGWTDGSVTTATNADVAGSCK